MLEPVFIEKKIINPHLMECIELMLDESFEDSDDPERTLKSIVDHYTPLLLTAGRLFGYDLMFEAHFSNAKRSSFSWMGSNHTIEIYLGDHIDSPLINFSHDLKHILSLGSLSPSTELPDYTVKSYVTNALMSTVFNSVGRSNRYLYGGIMVGARTQTSTATGAYYRLRTIQNQFKTLFSKSNLTAEQKQRATMLVTLCAIQAAHKMNYRSHELPKIKVGHIIKAVSKGYSLGQAYHLVNLNISTTEYLDVKDLPDSWFGEVSGNPFNGSSLPSLDFI